MFYKEKNFKNVEKIIVINNIIQQFKLQRIVCESRKRQEQSLLEINLNIALYELKKEKKKLVKLLHNYAKNTTS